MHESGLFPSSLCIPRQPGWRVDRNTIENVDQIIRRSQLHTVYYPISRDYAAGVPACDPPFSP
jgi:hypothetical protein